MMVVFISRSDKKATLSVRKVLDLFAERIGNDTWRTVITEAGLQQVKILLKERAIKNMAVACHYIRSRSRSELLWIVGRRDRFNPQGAVPVNHTQKNLNHAEWESDWRYLPSMKPLVALATLFHDWGKANDDFQQKLREKKSNIGDAFRHEWVSCQLLAEFIGKASARTDDRAWLTVLADDEWGKGEKKTSLSISSDQKLPPLPPIATAICWLIMSHHRLPVPFTVKNAGYDSDDMSGESIAAVFERLKADWGYARKAGSFTVKFSAGTLVDSAPWRKKLRKWAKRALDEYDHILELLQKDNKALRPALTFMRLSFVLGDYYFSAQNCQPNWAGNAKLYANTDKKIEGEDKRKQHLDEHLIGVSDQALKILQRLPALPEHMEAWRDCRSLRRKSPPQFSWQDKAAVKIKTFRREREAEDAERTYFIVNMASTGCGKTIANAKLLRAISPGGDELRYALALGLRSLTLQTGDEYRKRLHISEDDMAVLVGDVTARELHAADRRDDKESADEEIMTPAEREMLLSGELDFAADTPNDFLDIFLTQDAQNRAFLYKPIIAATIDHIVAATETIKGGKFLLPFMRLMSSDLVIDEVDDFDPNDLWTVARLTHLVGMLGRSVVISSATIPPDLAEALFYAYQRGREAYLAFHGKNGQTVGVWCDEHKTSVEPIISRRDFAEYQRRFVSKRLDFLAQQPVKRRAYLAECGQDCACEEYFEAMKSAALDLHANHNLTDGKTGKKISFGLIRLANIDPCVAMGRYLLQSELPPDYDVRVMIYHSRQTRLLRHVQEKQLDEVLKRSDSAAWERDVLQGDSVIRRHIERSAGKNIVFLVIATPVEEIGRDHDFDWAVVEPSSYRSIIQLAGRISRHRSLECPAGKPNIAIMQYNLRGLQGEEYAFCRPGYEGKNCPLLSHDLKELLEEKELAAGINAAPRLLKPQNLQPRRRLIDLEHRVMAVFNDTKKSGPNSLSGTFEEYWFLTGLAQRLHPFRAGETQLELYYCYGDKNNPQNNLAFYERSREGEFNSKDNYYNIREAPELNQTEKERLWLPRDFAREVWLYTAAGSREDRWALAQNAQKYGRLSVPEYFRTDMKETFYSDDFGLYRNVKQKSQEV